MRSRSKAKTLNNDDDDFDDDDDESSLPEAIRYTDDREFFENVELSPFLRPRGSPVLASTTDPTVWKCMQKVLREGDVEQMCVLSRFYGFGVNKTTTTTTTTTTRLLFAFLFFPF